MTGSHWASWGVTVTGPGHVRTGLPNQDAWAVRHFPSGVAAAVSDGLGSCRNADIGARAACRAVMEAASLHFRHASPTLLSMPLFTRHLWTMMLSGHPPEDCSATCLCVVSGPGVGSFLAQLGDGLIAACRADGTVDVLMPDKAETFANLTVGLASGGLAEHWRTISVPDDRYCAFVLCSDGIADDLESDGIRAFAWQVYAHYRDMPSRQRRRDVQRWLRDWPVPGHSDDKTVACIYRVEVSDG